MNVILNRRLGQHPAGSTVERTPSEAHWLLARGYARPAESAVDAPTPLTPPEDTPDAVRTTLTALRAQCARRGLPTSGTKATLTQRLAKSTHDSAHT